MEVKKITDHQLKKVTDQQKKLNYGRGVNKKLKPGISWRLVNDIKMYHTLQTYSPT